MNERRPWQTTENKRRKLAAMRELRFEPCGKSSEYDLHERVACCVCGYATPFYRLDLATKHREHCVASSRSEQRVETTQQRVETSTPRTSDWRSARAVVRETTLDEAATLDERELLRRVALAFATRNEHDTSYDDEPIKWGP